MISTTRRGELTARASGVEPGRLVLVVACAAEFMVVLDASVVNVALPAIRPSLGFDTSTLSWVVNAYVLVFAGCLLLGGRLTDLVGCRRAFLSGMTIFLAASVVGGLAVTPWMLVAARAVQALGAALLAPASLATLTTHFDEGPRRTRALAIWTALASAGGAAGSLLGGVLTEFLSWRATLLINLPLGLIAGYLAARTLAPDAPATARSRLDLPGAVAATLGVAAATYAVSTAAERGWTAAPTLGALAIAVGMSSLFLLIEARWSPAPLLPLRVLRLPAVGMGNIAMLLAGACLMPMWYFLSLYFQFGLHLSPLLAGAAFLPHTVITVAVGARLAPRLMLRRPAWLIVGIGGLIAAAGFLWQAQLDPSDNYVSGVLGPAVVLSIGVGLLNTPLTTLVTSGVDRADAGVASGLMNTTKQLGGALGLAALVSLTSAVGGETDPGTVTSQTAGAFLAMAVVLVAVAIVAAGIGRSRSER